MNSKVWRLNMPGANHVMSFIMTLVVPQFGEIAGVGSAVLLRLVWLAAELIVAGILYVGARGKESEA